MYGDGGPGILPHRPTVTKPPETWAWVKRTVTSSRNPRSSQPGKSSLLLNLARLGAECTTGGMGSDAA